MDRLPAIAVPFGEPLQAVDQGRESSQRRCLAEHLPVGPRGITGNRGSRRDISDDTALRPDSGPSTYAEVVGEASLPAQDDVVIHLGASGDPDLRQDQASCTDPYIVPDVDQVVDLGPRADDGIAHAASIDCAIGSHFYSVSQQAPSNVRYPVVSGSLRHVPEPAPADSRSGLQRYPVPERRPRGHHRVWPDVAPISQPASRANHRERSDDAVRAKLRTSRNYRTGPQRDATGPSGA